MLYLAGQLLKWACLLAPLSDHNLPLRSTSLLLIDNRISLEVYDVIPPEKLFGTRLLLRVGGSGILDINGHDCGEDMSDCLKRLCPKKDFEIDLHADDGRRGYAPSKNIIHALAIINSSAPSKKRVPVCVYLPGGQKPKGKLWPIENFSKNQKARE
jgi:hypothetical protein